MNILYDNIIFSLQKVGGISVVWKNLVMRMNNSARCSYIEYDNAQKNICRCEMNLNTKDVNMLPSRWIKILRFLNPRLSQAKSFSAGDDWFIFHSSYYRTLSHPHAINITTVHDFAYEYYVRNPLARKLHCWQKHRAIHQSDYVVCISENTRKDLLKFLPEVDPARVSVIYNGVDARFNVDETVRKVESILYVGNRDRYKNFNALIEPLAACGRKLKIVGKPLSSAETERMEQCNLEYEFCGSVSDQELNCLYNEAFCLLYTSLYEGFGLPVIEAQMAGCPVIAYNASSIPEVIGDQRMLVDEISAETLAEKFELLADPRQREKIVEQGLKNAQRFSWEKMANQYMELYRESLRKGKKR